MSEDTDITIVDYHGRFAREAVAMWRESKEAALGIPEVHSFENQLDFLRSKLTADNAVSLAIHMPTDSVVGIMATDGTELSQLYIHVDFQRRGIGTRLLSLAKQRSNGTLRLYTFEVNSAAQAFYEKHGFKVIARGDDNEEGLPDIRYEWVGRR